MTAMEIVKDVLFLLNLKSIKCCPCLSGFEYGNMIVVKSINRCGKPGGFCFGNCTLHKLVRGSGAGGRKR